MSTAVHINAITTAIAARTSGWRVSVVRSAQCGRRQGGRLGGGGHAAIPADGSAPAISKPMRAVVASRARKHRHETAAEQNADPVADGEHLFELGRDIQNGRAALPDFENAIQDEARRPRVQSPGRLQGHEHPGRTVHFARDHDLLLVAAGQLSGGGARARRADIEVSNQAASRGDLCGTVQPQPCSRIGPAAAHRAAPGSRRRSSLERDWSGSGRRGCRRGRPARARRRCAA